jgi:NAD(P)-dependent dehydrogenase (short-subunit alcohol dehydrogenase family)
VPDFIKDQILGSMPISRMGEVGDIVNACLFLLSDEATWITAQILAVDGGQIMRT